MPRASRYVGGEQDAGGPFLTGLLTVRVAGGCGTGCGGGTKLDGVGTAAGSATSTRSSSTIIPCARGDWEKTIFGGAACGSETGPVAGSCNGLLRRVRQMKLLPNAN